MLAAEWKSPASIVRIHDEYCEPSADHCLSQLNRIVSKSYKRRQMSNGNVSESAAAINIAADIVKS